MLLISLESLVPNFIHTRVLDLPKHDVALVC